MVKLYMMRLIQTSTAHIFFDHPAILILFSMRFIFNIVPLAGHISSISIAVLGSYWSKRSSSIDMTLHQLFFSPLSLNKEYYLVRNLLQETLPLFMTFGSICGTFSITYANLLINSQQLLSYAI